MISLTTDHKFVVREGVDEVINRVVAFKRRVHAPAGLRLGE